MSGEQLIDADGYFILDADGNWDICDACCDECSCCGCYYKLTYSGGAGPCEGCTIEPFEVYLPAFDCEGDTFGTGDTTGFYRLDGILYLFVELAPDCDPLIVYFYELAMPECPVNGTYELPLVAASPPGSEDPCVGPITCVVEKVYCPDCCPCIGNCYYVAVSGGDPESNCEICAAEESGLVEISSCINCVPMLTSGSLCIRTSSDEFPEPANSLIPIGGSYFNWGTAITGDCSSASQQQYAGPGDIDVPRLCPVDGVYTLYPIFPTSNEFCTIENTKTVTILRASCCPLLSGTESPEYYVSFDYDSMSYYSIDGDATDCDGNPNGVANCHLYGAAEDIPLQPADMGTFWFDNAVWSPTEDNCAFVWPGIRIKLDCVDGTWELSLFANYDCQTIKLGGMTPVGAYPDIDICFTDGSLSLRISVTNIVVTA